MTRRLIVLALAALVFPIASARADDKPKEGRVFEIRTYYANEGKLDALHKRFRDHTCKLFQKHGMELVGFWTPQEEKQGKKDTLIYILAYPSREAAKKSWAAFGADPEWKKVRDESHKDGVLVKKVESVFVDATDYSPIK